MTLSQFKEYTKLSWELPRNEEPSINFRPWSSDEGPPSHSIPPHLMAKTAERLGMIAFEQVHDYMFHAFYTNSRDITSLQVLKEIWGELDLPLEAFEEIHNPIILNIVMEQHKEALIHDTTGVPAVRIESGLHSVIVCAEPEENYRRLIQSMLEK